MSTTSLSDSERRQLVAVADRYGTPTYVYYEATVRRQCQRLRALLDGVDARVLYAMKANASPAILQIIRDEGLGLEVVSTGELILALRIGFDASQILFSANNMTDEEMSAAHDSGALLNIGELSRLDKYGRRYPGSEVSVRLNPQVGAGHHEHVITAGVKSKFGIPVEEAPEVRRILNRHGLRLSGLHQHIGSGILDAGDFVRAITVLLDAAPAFPGIRFLNFGGGIGIPYHPDDEELDFGHFRATVLPLLRDFRAEGGSAVEFWFEPGRFLVAQSGLLLVEVNTLKHSNGRVFAGTNSGMGHLVRPAIYGSYHGIENLTNPDGPLATYDVAGNLCESGDLFARDRQLPEVREGDLLAVMDSGAYGMAMASTYNLRPLPAEVLVDGDGEYRLSRRRLSIEEFVDRYLADVDPALEPVRHLPA